MSRPLRIGLVNQGGAGWIGGSEYIRNLILALGRLPETERAGFEFSLISGQAVEPAFAAQIQPHVRRIYDLSKDLPAPTRFRQWRWKAQGRYGGKTNPRFSDFLAAEQFDFLYPLTYDSEYNIGVPQPLGPTLAACRWAGWIPDFQHRFLPDFFSAKELARREMSIKTLVDEARTLVFSSSSAEEDFRRFYPEAHAQTEVLHFFTSPNTAWYQGEPGEIQQRFHLPDRFFLVSNQFWQHKNHRVVFDALALLRARGLTVDVVCTGQTQDFRNPGYFDSLLRQIHQLGIAPQVRILGLIERSEQIQLMRRCVGVIQPSLFEGWSTVLEDSRALGRPLLASDLKVHLEQNPPRARFLSPHDPESLAQLISTTLQDCEPGPALEREETARVEVAQLALGYGRRFLEIVRRALP